MTETIKDAVPRRRTFAIIAHPDAGKTTLTEKLLLFGGAIQLAGEVKAKKDRIQTRSDWMKIERERGISVVTSVMTFEYGDQPGSPDSGPRCTADIILCLPVLRAEARAQHKPLIDHLAHLVIHGVLHAQGYDHQDERDAARELRHEHEGDAEDDRDRHRHEGQ